MLLQLAFVSRKPKKTNLDSRQDELSGSPELQKPTTRQVVSQDQEEFLEMSTPGGENLEKLPLLNCQKKQSSKPRGDEKMSRADGRGSHALVSGEFDTLPHGMGQSVQVSRM